MKKVLEYIRKHYIFFTIIIAIILVIIGSLVVFKLIKDKKVVVDVKTEDIYLYQYVNDQKKEYKASIKYENNKIVSINSKEYTPYEKSLMYYKDEDKVFIPKDTMIIFYYQDNISYKLPKYSLIHDDNNSNVINIDNKKYAEDSFLVYDNEDLYFFITDTTLNYNGNEILLGKYSYVIASSDGITYYNYGTKEIFRNEDTVTKAVITINDLKIDLLTDCLVYSGKVRMLNRDMSALKIYKED